MSDSSMVRLRQGFGGQPSTTRVTRPANRSREGSERLAKVGGEGGIRTHVPLTGQDAFEAPPLRPLRYLSGSVCRAAAGDRLRALASVPTGRKHIIIHAPPPPSALRRDRRRLPTALEELLDELAAGLLEHAAGDEEPVVESRRVERTHGRCERAGPGLQC